MVLGRQVPFGRLSTKNDGRSESKRFWLLQTTPSLFLSAWPGFALQPVAAALDAKAPIRTSAHTAASTSFFILSSWSSPHLAELEPSCVFPVGACRSRHEYVGTDRT